MKCHRQATGKASQIACKLYQCYRKTWLIRTPHENSKLKVVFMRILYNSLEPICSPLYMYESQRTFSTKGNHIKMKLIMMTWHIQDRLPKAGKTGSLLDYTEKVWVKSIGIGGDGFMNRFGTQSTATFINQHVYFLDQNIWPHRTDVCLAS